ncbi:MAG: serine/threonine protein kinase, partial [Myxococcales bacterium]|nr:serine/threonine protein kinase [Myxococcales bacterium]
MSNKGATAPDGNIGRRLIDQYVLLDKIGEGGMGAVYLADQPTMGRSAVVKLLHPSLSRDPQVAARFNLEARAAAALNHPHIVTVYNYGALDDGVLFLAMEHLEGRNLERSIEESGRLSARRAVHVAVQICEALGEAHARGVVHRDLKPSNVMLVTRGRDDEFVKVLDFGIAKVRGVALSDSGTVFGTPEYMSPEQLRGRALDGRSDLYALGVVLFEMLTGRLPFACDTPEQWMTAHLERTPPTVSESAPDAELPRELEALVARLLAKDPATRPATAEELAERLAAAVADVPSTAVGGKRSDPRGQARARVAGGEARLRAALV